MTQSLLADWDRFGCRPGGFRSGRGSPGLSGSAGGRRLQQDNRGVQGRLPPGARVAPGRSGGEHQSEGEAGATGGGETHRGATKGGSACELELEPAGLESAGSGYVGVPPTETRPDIALVQEAIPPKTFPKTSAKSMKSCGRQPCRTDGGDRPSSLGSAILSRTGRTGAGERW